MLLFRNEKKVFFSSKLHEKSAGMHGELVSMRLNFLFILV